jgi:cytosine/adenosine deaminase-related metal-dependent hydrolase
MRRLLPISAASSLLALAGGLASTAGAAAAEVDRHVVLIQGNEAGETTVQSVADPGGARTITTRFSFIDRGRGPELESTIRVDENGVPTSVRTTGREYFKGEVDEAFLVQEGQASWRSRGEEGKTPFEEPAFYVPFDGTPVDLALLAATLLRTEGGGLPLLPAGEARLGEVAERTVSREGAERTVRRVEIDGLGFTPTPVWLTEEGALFAQVSGWLTVIAEGWEETVEELEQAQEEAANTRSARLADELGSRPAGALVLTGAGLFDPVGGVVQPGITVVVQGQRIVAVGADGTVAIPELARVIDAAGQTILPGLWDMHVHLSDDDGPLHLAAGVTSVRDLANDTDALLARAARWDAGEAIGPRVIFAGFMDGPGPYAGPTKVLVDTLEEAREAIDRYADQGHQQIKIYSSIDPALVPGIADHAHARGLRLSGHVPAFMTAEQAVRAGFDEIQHVNMLFLNFFPDVEDTRTPARFTAVAERAADLDLRSEEVQAFLDLLDSRDVVVDPTVGVFESMFTARPGIPDPQLAAVAARLPPVVRRSTLGGGLPVTDDTAAARHRASFEKLLEMVRRLHEEGIPIVGGTDALAGFSLHRELELYAEAGIPVAEVLRIATLGAAELTGRDDTLGTLAPGRLADLVVVPGNPLVDLSVLRRATLVVKDGVVYDPAAIYRALGVAPAD